MVDEWESRHIKHIVKHFIKKITDMYKHVIASKSKKEENIRILHKNDSVQRESKLRLLQQGHTHKNDHWLKLIMHNRTHLGEVTVGILDLFARYNSSDYQ